MKRRLKIAILAAGFSTSLAFISPAAADAAPQEAWTNCGDYICTTYFTKAQTKAYANYFNGVAGTTGRIAEGAFCGFALAPVNKVLAIIGATSCPELTADYNVSAWKSASNDAVQAGGCLQAEKSRNGNPLLKPGYTTHPSYCRG
ncbi:hypothetical protein CH299_28555 [Rhodococcus sp. 14-2686-1-2]|nr:MULTISPECIES: hypothetical protein [unclassified Rhodococcus (in: high G+C Gram-positive bacteria)]OZE92867.1 hypothetical protein CH301_28035 [Rhodococcus sp. 15-1189-1-1a]OZF08123.1 hypothetical protein CH299_28555 [Rhodococcus sp. 14-2686-1-2]